MVAVAAGNSPARHGEPTPPPWIRSAVRDVLERAPSYRALSPEDRQSLAKSMVKVSTLAAGLIAEEGEVHDELGRHGARAPLARAQDQPDFGAAANRVASTTRNVLNAVSFPRFVTDLINGVFRAILGSTSQQMQQYVQLLNAVSTSAEGFERTQFGLSQVRQWVADHFPESIEYELPETEPGEAPDPEEVANVKLRLRPGASMPGEHEIRATLGVPPEEPIEASNPEQLVPFARRHLARQRQQMLATMVMLGMQRIVIDSGRISAAMRFHVDTRSAASEDRGSQLSVQNRVKASGSFGVGPWGASAEIESNIGYVSTQRSQSTEEMNTDLELNSSVELNFRSDYLPLNQMAAQAQADRIRNASINPVAQTDPAAERAARLQAQLASERERRASINDAIARRPSETPASLAPTTGGGTRPAPSTTPTTTPTATPAPARDGAPGGTTPTTATVPRPATPPTPTTTPAPAPAPAPTTTGPTASTPTNPSPTATAPATPARTTPATPPAPAPAGTTPAPVAPAPGTTANANAPGAMR